MTWKKTWFSYLLWFLYVLGVCALALGMAQRAGDMEAFRNLGKAAYIGIAIVPFALGGILYAVIRLMGRLFSGIEKKADPHICLALEAMAAVALVAVGILLRESGMPKVPGDISYYELTKLEAGKEVASFAHGALYYYLLLLRGVFLFVGNHWAAGIVLQILLQLVAGILLYAAVRKLAGVLPGLVVLAVVMVLPESVNMSLKYGPEIFYLCLYAVGLLWLATRMAMITENRFGRWYQSLSVLLTGLYIGVLTYTDILGVTLLLMAVLILFLDKGEDFSEEEKGMEHLVAFLLTIAGFLSAMLLSFGLNAAVSGQPILTIAGTWERLFVFEGYSLSGISDSFLGAGQPSIFVFFLLVLLATGIFGFFTRKKEEILSIWILGFLTALSLSYSSIASSNMDRFFLPQILLMILAAVAVRGCMLWQEEPEKRVAEEKEPKEQKQEEQKQLEPAEVPKPQRRFLDNPLPLPKKHVKKVMGYRIEVPEDLMNFDIEIRDDDNFDK